MNTHKNARLTAKGREAMVRAVEGGLSLPATLIGYLLRFALGAR